jgi:hypothetical protein
VLEFGAIDANCSSGSDASKCITHDPLLTTADAQEIDEKIDDGMPGTGNVMAHPSSCTTSSTANTAQYYTATSSPTLPACALIIGTGF